MPQFADVDDDAADVLVGQVVAALRHARESSGKSMHQLARETGMNQVAISRIEKGERSPTLRSVVKMAAALGIGLPALFAGKTVPPGRPGRS